MTDQLDEGEVSRSISVAVSATTAPSRKAILTVSTATSNRSAKLQQEPTAAAASKPVHEPTARVCETTG